MTTTAPDIRPVRSSPPAQDGGYVDVLIVGAGVSGIGAAHHLREAFPERSFVLLDTQENRGGTWWTHRYPGVRSDSDLFTYGYRHKPWRGPSIAEGGEILNYLDEVIEEDDLAGHIRYQHKVTTASWSSQDSQWTVQVTRLDTGEQQQWTTSWLFMCHGYYDHATPHRPDWPGTEDFGGVIVHPQQWPEDLDLAGKRVVVIGSGSTATTLIPAIASQADHVTMLQRSPSYFLAPPITSELALTLRALEVPDDWTHEILRRSYTAEFNELTRMSHETPDELHAFLMESIAPLLPEGFDIAKHLTPRYRPWQQRITIVPEGDLFEALREGKADIVTDTIDTFTEKGIRVSSGDELVADVVVTATGFDLSVLGGISLTVDGEPVDATQCLTWRGVMLSGIPNMAYMFGYFRHSWTLRVDLVSDLLMRLLTRMQEQGASTVVPTLRPEDQDMERRPWCDPENFNAGYIMRSQHVLFGQGDREPWIHLLDHAQEVQVLPHVDLDDGTLQYR